MKVKATSWANQKTYACILVSINAQVMWNAIKSHERTELTLDEFLDGCGGGVDLSRGE